LELIFGLAYYGFVLLLISLSPGYSFSNLIQFSEGIHVVNSAGNHGGSTNGRIWTPSYDDLKGTPGIEKELDFLGDKFKNNLDGGLKELLRLLGLIIVVGAMNIDDTLCDFSGYGSRVDILAPGLDVYAMNNDGVSVFFFSIFLQIPSEFIS